MMLCQDRGLPVDGTKEALIQTLMQWKLNALPIPAPSSPRLSQKEAAPEIKQPVRVGTMDISKMLMDHNDPADLDIPYEKLIFGKKLGAGGFKDCFAGTLDGDPIAIGEFRLQEFTKEDLKEIKHEISVLKQLRHDNIVRFIGISTHAKHLCIVTELCENGDLYDYMRRVPKPKFPQMISYMYDIAFGVSYLHTRRPSIIHRDLKSMNILISKDLKMKITDFGLARIRRGIRSLVHTQVGTPNWQAPEMWIIKPSYTEKVDVYSCGLIYWEILQWAAVPFPYHDLTEHELYIQVRDHGHRPPMDRLEAQYAFAPSILKLIRDMWAGDPTKRPSMPVVLERLQEFLE
jgi:serine/threonine protein kinase